MRDTTPKKLLSIINMYKQMHEEKPLSKNGKDRHNELVDKYKKQRKGTTTGTLIKIEYLK